MSAWAVEIIPTSFLVDTHTERAKLAKLSEQQSMAIQFRIINYLRHWCAPTADYHAPCEYQNSWGMAEGHGVSAISSSIWSNKYRPGGKKDPSYAQFNKSVTLRRRNTETSIALARYLRCVVDTNKTSRSPDTTSKLFQTLTTSICIISLLVWNHFFYLHF